MKSPTTSNQIALTSLRAGKTVTGRWQANKPGTAWERKPAAHPLEYIRPFWHLGRLNCGVHCYQLNNKLLTNVLGRSEEVPHTRVRYGNTDVKTVASSAGMLGANHGIYPGIYPGTPLAAIRWTRDLSDKEIDTAVATLLMMHPNHLVVVLRSFKP